MNIRHALAVTLLAGSAMAQAPYSEDEFPREWFFRHNEEQWEKHFSLVGKPMPKLELSDWMNGKLDLSKDLKGKVVVVDFWATWCGPCIASIPHNNELFEEHKDDGLVLIGVCGSRNGQEKMADVAESNGILYPIAKDATLESAEAWRVLWWPTYGVIDRSGKMRALGLNPDGVTNVVERLLKEPAPAGGDEAEAGEELPPIPAEWLEDRRGGRSAQDAMQGKKAPALQVSEWMNTEALDLEQLKGKVVLIDFWATWCGPCKAAVPHTNELADKFAKQGLVILGVCHPRGAEKMEATAKELGIRYPIVKDPEGKTIEAYGVNSYPDYYLIDRQGRLRIADCKNGSIDAAIEMLLNEKAGAPKEAGNKPGKKPAKKPVESGEPKKPAKRAAKLIK